MPDETLGDAVGEYGRGGPGGRAWERIEAELRREPRPAADAVERIMNDVRSAEARSVSPAWRTARHALRWLGPRSLTVGPAELVAASLLIATIGLLAVNRRTVAPSTLDRSAVVPAEARAARPLAAGETRPVRFVFTSADAREVAVVGDFNNWDSRATPLRRVAAEGVWSIVIPLSPGRHLYSFVVNGSVWVPDAEAALAPEDDLGGANSVVYVRRAS